MNHRARKVSQWEMIKEPLMVCVTTLICMIGLTLVFAYVNEIDKALNDFVKWFS